MRRVRYPGAPTRKRIERERRVIQDEPSIEEFVTGVLIRNRHRETFAWSHGDNACDHDSVVEDDPANPVRLSTFTRPDLIDLGETVHDPKVRGSKLFLSWYQEGVVVVDGKLIENLHVLEARRLVALAEAIAQLEASAA